ncbi:MAG TPA: hypothetical protein VFC63_23625 [Blastocatellia bacterium]|nr:hypothetical protein [Blastocatellia bacterium]
MLVKTLTTFLLLTALTFSVQAQSSKSKKKSKPSTATQTKPDATTQNALDAKDKVIEATKEYKVSVEHYLTFLEDDVKHANEKVDRLKKLLDDGLISKKEYENSQSELTAAQAKVDAQKKELASADNLIEEAEASKQLLLLPPPKVGTYQSTAALIRYNGASTWMISQTAELQAFFQQKFGRPLPISAFGQTATHEKMGFDHSNRVDVAVQPDSPEGQALMEYLRQRGIPFIAFRHAVPGSATGAHIHVGPASHRIQ